MESLSPLPYRALDRSQNATLVSEIGLGCWQLIADSPALGCDLLRYGRELDCHIVGGLLDGFSKPRHLLQSMDTLGSLAAGSTQDRATAKFRGETTTYSREK